MDCWEVAEKKLPGETEMEAEVRCNARWKVRLEEWNEEASEKQDNDPKYQARKIVEAAVEAEREGESYWSGRRSRIGSFHYGKSLWKNLMMTRGSGRNRPPRIT
jgi:hypothetical protein